MTTIPKNIITGIKYGQNNNKAKNKSLRIAVFIHF